MTPRAALPSLGEHEENHETKEANVSTVTTTSQAARKELAGFGGRLIGPDDAGYDEARKVYNAMIDKRPALIARCASPDDVAKTIAFAIDHDLLLAVRGGGHNGAGLGTCDDGVVIDLSLLKDVQVDPQARTVRVGGGCTWGEVDPATNEHGLATPSGIISTTGVGGLTLGGGIGHLTRKCGLTIDNLLEAELVLASGERVRASADEHPDLYWAIRGGGGNFGVVTSFLFRLHEVGTVVGGPTFWPVEQSAEVLSAYRDFLPAAPRELNGFFAFHIVPPAPPFPEEIHLRKVCGVVWCYVGSEEDAAKAMAPLLEAVARAADARCRADAAFGAAGRLRRSLSARRPVVLARRLRQGDPRRGRADPRPIRSRAADDEVHDAHVPDRRSRSRRRPVRHGLELPRRSLGLASSRASIPTRRTSRRSGGGASTTSRPCTPTRPAAPT